MKGQNIVGERIKQVRKKSKLNQEDLALKVGVARQTVSSWERGEFIPEGENLKKLAVALTTNSSYLLGETDNPDQFFLYSEIRPTDGRPALEVGMEVTGTKSYVELIPTGRINAPEPTQKRQPIESNVATLNDAILIPVVTDDVSACCGSGNIYPDEVKWEIVGYYPMDSSDLIGYTWQTNDFCVIKVSGDSMEPHFYEGERVLFVKAPDVQVTSGDFAVMLYQGKLLLRGIIFEKDGKIVLKATNEKYKDIFVPQNSDDLCILGKILGVVPAYRKTPGLW
jgi:transcriptional regulator with XRE-family HTH domain